MSATVSDALLRALDPGAAPPGDATSERILDAALHTAAAGGLRNLTMDEVARRARLGRMTVYRRFGDRARLVDALTARETRRALQQLDDAVDPSSPVADQIAEGFVASLRIAREHPLLDRLAARDPEAVLETLRGGAFALCRTFLAHRLREAQRAKALDPTLDADHAAEILVRLMVSFVLLQDTTLPLDDEDAARATARRLVAPIVSSRAG